MKADSKRKLDTRLVAPGFTLTELLVIIVIVGILSSLAIPNFREFLAAQRIKTAAFDVVTALALARSEAIKRSATVTITPAGGLWTAGWNITAADGAILNEHEALRGLTITFVCRITDGSTIVCPAGISYGSNGRLTAAVPSMQTTSIQIGSDYSNSVRCISIDLSGRPSSKTRAC